MREFVTLFFFDINKIQIPTVCIFIFFLFVSIRNMVCNARRRMAVERGAATNDLVGGWVR